MTKRKNELSSKEREELLRTLKACFEKNMNRHKGLEWAEVKAKLEANTFFMIAQQKVLKVAEVFVTTMMRLNQ